MTQRRDRPNTIFSSPPTNTHIHKTDLLLNTREQLDHVVNAVEPVVELLGGVLREVGYPEVGVAAHLPREGPQLVQDEVEEGRLSRTVGSDYADTRVQVYPEVYVGEERVGGVVPECHALDLFFVPAVVVCWNTVSGRVENIWAESQA